MQLVAMQVALTNIGTIDAVAGTFEVWLFISILMLGPVCLAHQDTLLAFDSSMPITSYQS